MRAGDIVFVHSGFAARFGAPEYGDHPYLSDAAAAWLKAHPETVDPWLVGVTTRDGGDAVAAVKAALGA